MTVPRRIVAGQTVMVTARAVNQAFRFVPTRKVTPTILYCFAYTLSRKDYRGIAVHEFLWMSNHFHIVLTAADDSLPAFMQALDSLMSRALNALRGTGGSNLEKHYNITVEADPNKIPEHCAYTLANPCKAHLVARAHHWKGASSVNMEYGKAIVIERPKFGMWATPKAEVDEANKKRRSTRRMSSVRKRHSGRWKTLEQVELRITRPKIHLDLSDAALREEVRRQVVGLEAKADKVRQESGRRVLGMRRVEKQHWNALPSQREDMFGPEPAAAGTNKWARIEQLQQRRAFIEAYRAALARYMDGDRDVVFPLGTWLMRRRFNVKCADTLAC